MYHLSEEIEKNFPRIEKFFSDEALAKFSRTAAGDLEKYNIGLGSMIRIKLLRPKSRLYRSFVRLDYTDEDKMAMRIIEEFHAYLQNR